MNNYSGEKLLYAVDRIRSRSMVRISILVAATILVPSMLYRDTGSWINLLVVSVFGTFLLSKVDPLFGAPERDFSNMGPVFMISFMLTFSTAIGTIFDILDFIPVVVVLVDHQVVLWTVGILVGSSLTAQLVLTWRLWTIARMTLDPTYSPPGLQSFAAATELLPTRTPSPQPFSGNGARLGSNQ
jgi:hypothetical protein